MNKLITIQLMFVVFFTSTLIAQPTDYSVYYSFDGNTNDASVNNLDGIQQNCSFVAGNNSVPMGAISFNGITSYVQIPNSPLIKHSLPVTVSLWIKVETGSSGVIFRTDVDPDVYFGYWIIVEPDYRIQLSMGNGGAPNSSGRRTKVSNAALTPGVWHHLTAIYRSGTNMDIYIDCENAGGTYSGSGSTSIGYSTNPTQLMRNETNSSANPFFVNGSMDNFAIYPRELNLQEIQRVCTISTASTPEEVITEINVSPNPSSSIFNVSIANSENHNYEVRDQSGKSIIIGTIENGSGAIDLSL